jgi:hypothetical protein
MIFVVGEPVSPIHGYDLKCLYPNYRFFPPEPTSIDYGDFQTVSRAMVKLWVTFARIG